MSLFNELKRRNVIRVAVAYAVAVWLLLQITDVLMSVLGLPEVVGKAVFLLLLVGFIPAVVFSWAYEITPQGIRRDGDVDPAESIAHQTARKLDVATIGMLLLVAALVLLDRLIPETAPPASTSVQTTEPDAGPRRAEVEQAQDQETTKAATPPGAGALPAPQASGITSVAVLPFANMSADPDNEYFADGISEELLNVLVEVDGLRVPSRTSSFAFKGQNLDIRDIAAQLRVSHILEGSVRKAGNQVRITAQLIDVTTDTHLWSETYDRSLEDIFAIQDEIASNIVRELEGVLRGKPGDEKPTEDLEAYTLFLQGRHLFQQRGENLLEAEKLLLQAVERDPEFAEAWAVLAATYINFPNYLFVDKDVAHGQALNAIEHAMRLDDSIAEANLALAQIETETVPPRLASGMAIYESVIEDHPKHSLARLWYAVALLQSGYLEQALVQMERAVELDPTYGLMLDWQARTLLLNRRFEAVEPPAIRAIQLGREQARIPLVFLYLSVGEFKDIEPYIEGSRIEDWGQVPWLFRLRENSELLPDAMDFLEELKERLGAPMAHLAEYPRLSMLMVAGDSRAFFRQLEVMQSTFDDTVTSFIWLPLAQRHRRDPSMKDWARSQGLEALWRERGWPDLCRPLEDDDFECD